MYTFKVHKDMHQDLSKLMKTGTVEYGGNTVLTINNRVGVLTKGQMTKGQFNNVNLPRGIVDWHTHPRTCRSPNNCTLGLPSPADMMNILIGSSKGNLAHMVYSTEGVYLIRVKEYVKLSITSNGDLSRVSNRIRSTFDVLFNKIAIISKKRYPTGVPIKIYNRWQQEWFALAATNFEVMLFDYDTCPSFVVHGDCRV